MRRASRERAGMGLRECADGRGWRLRGESYGRPDSGDSEVEVVGEGLFELEVGDGLGLGGIEGGRLIEEPLEEITLGRSASGREGRGFVGEVEVEEDGRDDWRISQKREDPHLGAATHASRGCSGHTCQRRLKMSQKRRLKVSHPPGSQSLTSGHGSLLGFATLLGWPVGRVGR